jgi:hypothetical protein
MPRTIAPTSCPSCTAPLVEIELPAGASVLTMQSCSSCDGRWWSRDGKAANLGQVLGAVAETGRARRAS